MDISRPVFVTIPMVVLPSRREIAINPSSLIVADTMVKLGIHSITLKQWHPHSRAIIKNSGLQVVPIFDIDSRFVNVNCWHPCQCTKDYVPEWVRQLSTGWCVGVSEDCCVCQEDIEGAAKQIYNRFVQKQKSVSVLPFSSVTLSSIRRR